MEKLVLCVHPKHQGGNHVSREEIKCQTWDMPNGVCRKCCTDNHPPDSIETVNALTFSYIKRDCGPCPARGY